ESGEFGSAAATSELSSGSGGGSGSGEVRCEWQISATQGEKVQIDIKWLDIQAEHNRQLRGALPGDSETDITGLTAAGAYRGDKECIWKIEVPTATQWRSSSSLLRSGLQFIDPPAAETHTQCVYDFVEVLEGWSQDGVSLGKFCGETVPKPVKSTGNRMTVRFKSDNSVNKIGFAATFEKEYDECMALHGGQQHGCQHICVNTLGGYHCDCRPGFHLHRDGRTCEDTCGGTLYPPNKHCKWHIIAPIGHKILLNFTTFDIEGRDVSLAWPLSSGHVTHPALIKSHPLPGHRAPVTSGHVTHLLSLISCPCPAHRAAGHVTHLLSLISSPAPGTELRSRDAPALINLIPCPATELRSRDAPALINLIPCRPPSSGHVTHLLSLISSPARAPSSTVTPALINLSPARAPSSGHVTPALINLIPCPGTELRSRDAPAALINHPLARQPSSGHRCEYDYLDIFDGVDEATSKRVGRYCGDQPPSVQGGFSASFMVDRDECAMMNGGCDQLCKEHHRLPTGYVLYGNHQCKEGGCKHRITRLSGEFSSPNYPRRYPLEKRCSWNFLTTPGHRNQTGVQALRDPSSHPQVFKHFEIERHPDCAYDHVEIRDGPDATSERIGVFCGDAMPPTPVISTGNSMFVGFVSDSSLQRKGFNADHSSICGQSASPRPRERERLLQPRRLRGQGLRDRENCNWTLTTSNPEEVIVLNMETFELESEIECGYDYVDIFDDDNDRGVLLAATAATCGREERIPYKVFPSTDSSAKVFPQYGFPVKCFPGPDGPIYSSRQSLHIRFRSDDTISFKGFHAVCTARCEPGGAAAPRAHRGGIIPRTDGPQTAC
uniref:CUB domain-containing protein n=1 Tax=Macrostomum lignano TaxID=282301 RepID=A0A1I8JRB3_9PLAT